MAFLSTPSARRATDGRFTGPCYIAKFLSTPSARRATYWCYDFFAFYRISIHALREEGDIVSLHVLTNAEDFYPRPPRGGRLFDDSNHPVIRLISIHALREEGD